MTVRSLGTVHRPRYFRFCNVLHIWTIRAIPTYRVYRLYDIYSQQLVNIITSIYVILEEIIASYSIYITYVVFNSYMKLRI